MTWYSRVGLTMAILGAIGAIGGGALGFAVGRRAAGAQAPPRTPGRAAAVLIVKPMRSRDAHSGFWSSATFPTALAERLRSPVCLDARSDTSTVLPDYILEGDVTTTSRRRELNLRLRRAGFAEPRWTATLWRMIGSDTTVPGELLSMIADAVTDAERPRTGTARGRP